MAQVFAAKFSGGELRFRHQDRFRTVLFLVIASLVLLDLVPFAQRYLGWGTRAETRAVRSEVQFLQRSAGQNRVLPLEYLLAPNTALSLGLETVTGYISVDFGSFRRLWGRIGIDDDGHAMIMPRLPTEPAARRALEIMGARFILSPRPLDAKDLVLVFHDRDYVYEDRAAQPRAKLYARWTVCPDEPTALETLLDPARDARDVAVIEESATQRAPQASRVARPGQCEIVAADPDHLVVQVQAEATQLLFVANRLVEGWTATLDGEPAALVPANHSFQGVFVPAGLHRVVLTYGFPSTTWGIRLNLALSASIFLALALGATQRARYPRD